MSLSAGASSVEITPRKQLYLTGYPHVERVSEGVNDPLFSSALFLGDGQSSVITISLDLLYLNPGFAKALRRAIQDKTGVPESHVLVSCTHTHSGPLTAEILAWRDDPTVPTPDAEYMDYLKAKVVESAVKAAETRRPAEIAWTSADIEGVGGNRHDPSWPRDPQAGVALVRGKGDRKTIALSVVYSMHPTVMHEDSKLVSSDFPGYARKYLQDRLGQGVSVVYHLGPAGNQSPRHHVRGQTFAEAERLGFLLGRQVHESVSALRDADFSGDVVLAATIGRASLVFKRPPSLDEAEANLAACVERYERLKREDAGHGPVRTAECVVFGAEEAVTLARAESAGELAALRERYNPVEVQVLRIGEAFLVGLPGEIFVEYALELKRRFQNKVFVVSLVNGDTQGYIVTPEAAARGGYEASYGIFAPESGTVLVEAAERLVKQLGGESR